MFPANPGTVTNIILQAPTAQSVRICTGEPADGVDILPKKLGCIVFSFGASWHHGCPPSRPPWFPVQVLFGDLEQAAKHARFDGFAIGLAAGGQDTDLPLARNRPRR